MLLDSAKFAKQSTDQENFCPSRRKELARQVENAKIQETKERHIKKNNQCLELMKKLDKVKVTANPDAGNSSKERFFPKSTDLHRGLWQMRDMLRSSRLSPTFSSYRNL